jgi:hypothetical protein
MTLAELYRLDYLTHLGARPPPGADRGQVVAKCPLGIDGLPCAKIHVSAFPVGAFARRMLPRADVYTDAVVAMWAFMTAAVRWLGGGHVVVTYDPSFDGDCHPEDDMMRWVQQRTAKYMELTARTPIAWLGTYVADELEKANRQADEL